MGFTPENATGRIGIALRERRPRVAAGRGARPGHAARCRLLRVWIGLAACCGLLCIFAIASQADAAFEFRAVGARPGGMGDTFAGCAEGVDGVFWNAGAVAWGKGVSITGGYERPFGMAVLDAHAIGAVASTGRAAVGLSYLEYGFSLYRERTGGLTIGLRVVPRLGLGARIRRMQLSVAGAGRRAWTAFDLGVRIVLSPRIALGFAAWNAGGQSVDVLGQGGMAGVAFEAVRNVALLVDVRKEAGRSTGVSAGVEYRPARRVVLRMGAGGGAERLCVGAGALHRGLRIDYAALHHTVLGLTHRVSLTIGR
ncbi:MAG: hypothetical protein OXR72_10790 [Gemmatimonadota bacterium]|nr:hypothetical protein [Gemmatimonadota bacterium]